MTAKVPTKKRCPPSICFIKLPTVIRSSSSTRPGIEKGSLNSFGTIGTTPENMLDGERSISARDKYLVLTTVCFPVLSISFTSTDMHLSENFRLASSKILLDPALLKSEYADSKMPFLLLMLFAIFTLTIVCRGTDCPVLMSLHITPVSVT